jgi:hypothetical protein
MSLKSLFAGALLALLIVPAFAQAQENPTIRIRGTTEGLEGSVLTVNTREGDTVKVNIGEKTAINTARRRHLRDIKEGEFIGTAAIEGKDGKLHAEEVLIFPEWARGMAEGHYPWDLTPGDTMTNATVATVTNLKRHGHVLELKHKNGENEVVVDSRTPIVTFEKANTKAVRPKGRHVFIVAAKQPDGSVNALFIIAEKNRVRPPM